MDDGCGNDNIVFEGEATVVSMALFVNTSTSFRNSFPLNIIGYPYWIQGI
jgi:hypothetical protein